MNSVLPVLELDFYLSILPILILCGGSLATLLQEFAKSLANTTMIYLTVIITFTLALVATLWFAPTEATSYLDGTFVAGDLSRWGQALVIGIALAVTLFFREHWMKESFFKGDVASLFMMMVAGTCVMLTSEDLITLFVGLELSSIGLYAVVGYTHPDRGSQEAGIKYFVLGSFAAAIMLFGFGLLYAGTGTMQLSAMIDAIALSPDQTWIQIGAIFALAGLSLKLALAPFHFWAPDAYEAAPTGITAFMATAIKVMIIIVITRLLNQGVNSIFSAWMPGMMFIAILSMIFGNVMALVQMNLKRMLAYSSIAHSGYMAVAICAMGATGNPLPVTSILFYVISYTIISIGAFGIIMWLESEEKQDLQVQDLRGLYKRHPWASAAMAIFMFAFAGMPPTVGFMAKFFVFSAAISGNLFSIVVIGVIGSTISFYYYLRVIVNMYMQEQDEPLMARRRAPATLVVLAGAALLTILLGTVLPGQFFDASRNTATEVAH